MVPFLYGPREHHGAQTPAEYARRHAQHMHEKGTRGHRSQVHDSPVALVARIDHNTWLVDCECGAGNAVDPDWPVAHCFGCGAVHRQIRVPPIELRQLIEAPLLRRVQPHLRSWTPGETVEQLERETEALHAGHDPRQASGRRVTFHGDHPLPIVEAL